MMQSILSPKPMPRRMQFEPVRASFGQGHCPNVPLENVHYRYRYIYDDVRIYTYITYRYICYNHAYTIYYIYPYIYRHNIYIYIMYDTYLAVISHHPDVALPLPELGHVATCQTPWAHDQNEHDQGPEQLPH